MVLVIVFEEREREEFQREVKSEEGFYYAKVFDIDVENMECTLFRAQTQGVSILLGCDKG